MTKTKPTTGSRPRGAQVNVSTDPAKTRDMMEGDSMIVDFTYSVKWKETTIPFERRMEKYSRYSFLPQHLEVGQPCVLPAHAPLPGFVGLLLSLHFHFHRIMDFSTCILPYQFAADVDSAFIEACEGACG